MLLEIKRVAIHLTLEEKQRKIVSLVNYQHY